MAGPEIAGYPNVKLRHVEDPDRPFAAMVSAVSGFSIEAVQRCLDEAGLPHPNGETGTAGAIGKARFEGRSETVTIRPIRLIGVKGPEGIIARVNDEFASGNAVAIWHKSDRDKGAPYTWALLVGSTPDADGGDAVQVMNPNRDHMGYYDPQKVLGIVESSTAEGARGIYAYAVNTEASPALGTTPESPTQA